VITRIVEGIDGAREAHGTVVVIDVMRAFTTAHSSESVVATVLTSAPRRGTGR
jgi:hypothetical protein